MIIKIWVQKSQTETPIPLFLEKVPKWLCANPLGGDIGQVVDSEEGGGYIIYSIQIYPEKIREVREWKL